MTNLESNILNQANPNPTATMKPRATITSRRYLAGGSGVLAEGPPSLADLQPDVELSINRLARGNQHRSRGLTGQSGECGIAPSDQIR